MADNVLKREPTEAVPVRITAAGPEPDSASTANATTNLRNVSACNRCRTRKGRCDQKLPRCTSCEKARVKCVGFDPISKRTIPRSYVYYLETRTKRLEDLLQENGIAFEPPESDFSINEAIQPGINVPFPIEAKHGDPLQPLATTERHPGPPYAPGNVARPKDSNTNIVDSDEAERGSGEPCGQRQRTGSTSASVSFAKVVFAAVRSTVSNAPPDRSARKASKQPHGHDAHAGCSARDSFFGLRTRSDANPAPFPDLEQGKRLASLYFDYANPQIPTLHRGEFMSLFENVYKTEASKRPSRELYFLNIVFAIGSGIINDTSSTTLSQNSEDNQNGRGNKRQKLTDQQYQLEEYHAAAMVHLEGFSRGHPTSSSGGSGLEELQGVLLLAGLALLRPIAPGLWYIVGVAVRLAVDLGLYTEDSEAEAMGPADDTNGSKDLGRKQWTTDLRRRLWWCTYSLDRLVSNCVGRPFGVTDHVVTTDFPSILDDEHITTNGFSGLFDTPTYKLVAHHYFRLRLLQSEILQVLQHRQAEQARLRGANRNNAFIHKKLISPFMGEFPSFQDWRVDADRRLCVWRDSAPRQESTGVAFPTLFLELNYWQAVIMLYRPSLRMPEHLADLTSAAPDDVQSPSTVNERQEDEEMVLMKVAQAGQMVLKLYRQLHRLKLVNYTYLATHHLFMSGISFLYAIWHSALVRSQLTLDDVDFTVLIATSVLGDLIAKCPPAEACRDAFSRMAKATIAMVEKSTGFGSTSTLSAHPLNVPADAPSAPQDEAAFVEQRQPRQQPVMPQFDMDLKALFSQDELLARQFNVHTASHRAQHARARAAPPRLGQPPMMQRQASSSDYSNPVSSDQQEDSATRSATYFSHAAYTQPPVHGPISTTPVSTHSDSTLLQPQYLLHTTSNPLQPSDFANDGDISFLETFPTSTSDAAIDWSSEWTDFDMGLGFATGGTATAWDNGGDWAGAGGVDMFDGFFFGDGSNMYTGGGFG